MFKPELPATSTRITFIDLYHSSWQRLSQISTSEWMISNVLGQHIELDLVKNIIYLGCFELSRTGWPPTDETNICPHRPPSPSTGKLRPAFPFSQLHPELEGSFRLFFFVVLLGFWLFFFFF